MRNQLFPDILIWNTARYSTTFFRVWVSGFPMFQYLILFLPDQPHVCYNFYMVQSVCYQYCRQERILLILCRILVIFGFGQNFGYFILLILRISLVLFILLILFILLVSVLSPYHLSYIAHFEFRIHFCLFCYFVYIIAQFSYSLIYQFPYIAYFEFSIEFCLFCLFCSYCLYTV